MPFMPVTRTMAARRAERKKTLQKYEIGAASAKFDTAKKAAMQNLTTAQQGLIADYQNRTAQYSQQLGQYQQAMSSYDQQLAQYQARANEYNQRVNLYNTYTRLPGKFEMRDSVLRAYGGEPISSPEYDVFRGGRGAIFRDDGGGEGIWQTPNWNLPAGLQLEYANERKGKYGVYYLTKRAGPDPGEFTDPFPTAPNISAPTMPTPADTSGVTAQYTKTIEEEKQAFEREIGERKLASQRARRRVSDRPLLAGEAA